MVRQPGWNANCASPAAVSGRAGAGGKGGVAASAGMNSAAARGLRSQRPGMTCVWMKTRDSGMPDEEWWESFFQPEETLDALGLDRIEGPLLDVGCGYGTFALAAARRCAGAVEALDIEPAMVERTLTRARQAGLLNVTGRLVDATAGSLGVPESSVAVVLLFNLLHCEEPLVLLAAARDALQAGGRLAAIHWRRDVPTPRGPDLSIRPGPERLRSLLVEAGFEIEVEPAVIPPYHVGVVGRKPRS